MHLFKDPSFLNIIENKSRNYNPSSNNIHPKCLHSLLVIVGGQFLSNVLSPILSKIILKYPKKEISNIPSC